MRLILVQVEYVRQLRGGGGSIKEQRAAGQSAQRIVYL